MRTFHHVDIASPVYEQVSCGHVGIDSEEQGVQGWNKSDRKGVQDVSAVSDNECEMEERFVRGEMESEEFVVDSEEEARDEERVDDNESICVESDLGSEDDFGNEDGQQVGMSDWDDGESDDIEIRTDSESEVDEKGDEQREQGTCHEWEGEQFEYISLDAEACAARPHWIPIPITPEKVTTTWETSSEEDCEVIEEEECIPEDPIPGTPTLDENVYTKEGVQCSSSATGISTPQFIVPANPSLPIIRRNEIPDTPASPDCPVVTNQRQVLPPREVPDTPASPGCLLAPSVPDTPASPDVPLPGGEGGGPNGATGNEGHPRTFRSWGCIPDHAPYSPNHAGYDDYIPSYSPSGNVTMIKVSQSDQTDMTNRVMIIAETDKTKHKKADNISEKRTLPKDANKISGIGYDNSHLLDWQLHRWEDMSRPAYHDRRKPMDPRVFDKKFAAQSAQTNSSCLQTRDTATQTVLAQTFILDPDGLEEGKVLYSRGSLETTVTTAGSSSASTPPPGRSSTITTSAGSSFAGTSVPGRSSTVGSSFASTPALGRSSTTYSPSASAFALGRSSSSAGTSVPVRSSTAGSSSVITSAAGRSLAVNSSAPSSSVSLPSTLKRVASSTEPPRPWISRKTKPKKLIAPIKKKKKE